ncbi:MAG TPA: hypothetical protein VIS77_01000 [Burkholderiales bacterium]
MAIISTPPAVALIKTRWRNKGARTHAERAGVIGTNIWKVSQGVFKHMEKEGFRFGSDRMVTTVLTEFIAFMVQLVDRAVYGKVDEADRATLIGELAGHLATTMENNLRDLLGPGEYRKPFIDTLNARSGEYAGFDCPGGVPDYACVRYFATMVSEAMADGDSKWVVEQMMDIEAPEMVRLAHKLVDLAVSAPAR